MLRPLSDYLIVKVEEEKQSVSGIIIPETADKERPEQGEVIAVGPGKLNEQGLRMPLEVKVGDKVIFKKYAPDEADDHLIIREMDVMAVIE